MPCNWLLQWLSSPSPLPSHVRQQTTRPFSCHWISVQRQAAGEGLNPFCAAEHTAMLYGLPDAARVPAVLHPALLEASFYRLSPWLHDSAGPVITCTTPVTATSPCCTTSCKLALKAPEQPQQVQGHSPCAPPTHTAPKPATDLLTSMLAADCSHVMS